jgi:hypothetical protein
LPAADGWPVSEKAYSENLLNRGYYIARGNLFNRIIRHSKELEKLHPDDLKNPGWTEKGGT